MTALIYTIEVTSTCTGWSEVYPAAERLARDAAERAAVRGMAASGLACRAPVELGITLASAVKQQRLNRDYREQDAPTNVLAFPAWEPGTHIPPGAPLLSRRDTGASVRDPQEIESILFRYWTDFVFSVLDFPCPEAKIPPPTEVAGERSMGCAR